MAIFLRAKSAAIGIRECTKGCERAEPKSVLEYCLQLCFVELCMTGSPVPNAQCHHPVALLTMHFLFFRSFFCFSGSRHLESICLKVSRSGKDAIDTVRRCTVQWCCFVMVMGVKVKVN